MEESVSDLDRQPSSTEVREESPLQSPPKTTGFREQYGKLLEQIAQDSEKIALRYFRTSELKVERKSDGTALTPADREIEAMARSKVAASGLALDLLGEESSSVAEREPHRASRPRLIIDPIDGTEEFSRGIPIFATLLGIEKDGEIVAGFVTAPALRSRWWAYRGQGAFRDGRKLRVSDVARLRDSLIFTTGTGLSKNAHDLAHIRRLLDVSRHSRCFGGFWQHMLVAEGAIAAALDWTSKPWDLAPLILIVEEAGGRSTSASGKRTIYEGVLLSTNGRVHDEALALLQ
jgi:histidinol-phosphatase